MSIRILRSFIVIALVLAGCSGDEGVSSDTAEPATTAAATATVVTQAEPGEPSLTLEVDDLGDFQGRIVVAIMSPVGGGQSGSVCLPTDGSQTSAVFSTFGPDNPCDNEPPAGEVISGAGEYEVTVGVLVPGQQSPEACFETTLSMTGPTELLVTGADLGADCSGF